MLTKHAKTRCQQRGIPPMVVDLLRNYGTVEKCPGGATRYSFDKKARQRVSAYAGSLAGLLQSHLDTYLVVGDEDHVITVGHLLKREHRL